MGTRSAPRKRTLRRERALAWAILTLAAFAPGCGARQATRELLANSLAEIVPHHDRDHFVFLVERPSPEGFRPSALQVEHVSKLTDSGDYEVALSEDGMATGKVLIRDDGQTLWLVSEEDYTRGFKLTYEPPLPYLSVPLFAGETKATSSADVRQLGTNQAAGRLQVTQTTRTAAAPPGQWMFGTYSRGVQLTTERTLVGPDGPLQLTNVTILVPGVGEVRSEGSAAGSPVLRRQLACAIVANRSVGNCAQLFQLLERSGLR